jgi:hypothetical protein
MQFLENGISPILCSVSLDIPDVFDLYLRPPQQLLVLNPGALLRSFQDRIPALACERR